MNKKGQGLSITTIIVAAIALIVLVVLVAIFTGRIGMFSSGVDDASSSGICFKNAPNSKATESAVYQRCSQPLEVDGYWSALTTQALFTDCGGTPDQPKPCYICTDTRVNCLGGN